MTADDSETNATQIVKLDSAIARSHWSCAKTTLDGIIVSSPTPHITDKLQVRTSYDVSFHTYDT